jgi:hypothetical protein
MLLHYQNSISQELKSLVTIGETVWIVGRVREGLKQIAAVVEPKKNKFVSKQNFSQLKDSSLSSI